MNKDNQKEVKGTPGVNASQTKGNEPTNGTVKTNVPATAEETQKPEPVKEKTIEEQMKFFDGLATLVNTKRRFENHKEAVKILTISDEELQKFESEKRYGVRIVLHDEENKEYTINNPKLVKEVQAFLINVIEAKVLEYDKKIMTYGSK